MDYKQSLSLINFLAKEWDIDPGICFEILKLIHDKNIIRHTPPARFLNEFSFICDNNYKVEEKIRILNLLFPANFKDREARRLESFRLASIFEVLEKLEGRKIIIGNISAIKKLLTRVSKNTDWVFQFGLELRKGKSIKTKIYLGIANRDAHYPIFIIELLQEICDIFGIDYNYLVNSIIFNNKIDSLGINLTESGWGLKIYDYVLYPDRKETHDLLEKYQSFGKEREGPLYEDFCRIIRENKIYGKRNFDTSLTYKFCDNSMDLKSVKINIHLDPLAEAEKIFKGTLLAKSALCRFLKANNIRVSFIGHEFQKMFFYVR